VITHASLLLVALMWGATFVSIRYLLRSISATSVLLLRVELASLCFAAMLLVGWRSFPRFPAVIWRRLFLIAICGVLAHNLAVTYSQLYISASLASLLGATNPVFTAVFSALLLGEVLTRRKLGGIAIAFAGFLIVLLLGSSGARFSADHLVGALILMGSPVGWALYTVLSKPLIGRYEPSTIAGVTTVMGGLMFLPLLTLEPDLASSVTGLDFVGWVAVLTMSVLAMFVGYILWNRGLRTLEATQVAVYMYMTPFFGLLLAWLLLGESIGPWLLAGGATIVAGVIVTNSGRPHPPAPSPARRGGAGPECSDYVTPSPRGRGGWGVRSLQPHRDRHRAAAGDARAGGRGLDEDLPDLDDADVDPRR
jgi:drug/metabolite transporter (DMT)-like permease